VVKEAEMKKSAKNAGKTTSKVVVSKTQKGAITTAKNLGRSSYTVRTVDGKIVRKVPVGSKVIVPFGVTKVPATVTDQRRGRVFVNIPVTNADDTLQSSFLPDEIEVVK